MLSAPAASLPLDRHGEPVDLEAARALLTPLSPQERLAWAQNAFGPGFALTTSFGIQSAVLLHMVSELAERSGQPVQVIWIDTGYLPSETYQYADQLSERLRLSLHVAQGSISPAHMEARHGRLWESGEVADLELYHRLRKVEPSIGPCRICRCAAGPVACGAVRPTTVAPCRPWIRFGGCGRCGLC